MVAAELVTSRGLITAGSSRRVMESAHELAANPRIDVLSITDNPGGHAMLAPDTIGTDLIAQGQEVIIHLSCKDWNRNALESRGWKLGSEGFANVLALSGDYPVTGHKGLAAPVFDLDSVGLLSLFESMNEGLRDERKPETRLDRTNFFLGCVVTNHKRREREVMPQYFKLRKKVEAGARFVINQIGWNARKDDELLRWIRRDKLPVSVLANVYLLSGRRRVRFTADRSPVSSSTTSSSRLRSVTQRARTRVTPSSLTLPPSTSPSYGGSASTVSTSEVTRPRPLSDRSSIWRARSQTATGGSLRERSTSRPLTSSISSSRIRRRNSPRTR